MEVTEVKSDTEEKESYVKIGDTFVIDKRSKKKHESLADFSVKNAVDKTSRRKESANLQTLTEACTTILQCLGEEQPFREGVEKTPKRMAESLLYLTKGYDHNIVEGIYCELIF
jgi:hypothetical protein